ncbi:MAG: hypothetical protein WBP29_01310 [Candidatus Zixiibacteriota bacterium]
MKRILLSTIVVLAVTGPLSCTGVVYVETEPPPLRVEARSAPPSPFAIWIDGFWSWRRNDFVWVPGHWEANPRGVWVSGYWERHPRGYRWVPGYWADDTQARHGRGRHRGY